MFYKMRTAEKYYVIPLKGQEHQRSVNKKTRNQFFLPMTFQMQETSVKLVYEVHKNRGNQIKLNFLVVQVLD